MIFITISFLRKFTMFISSAYKNYEYTKFGSIHSVGDTFVPKDDENLRNKNNPFLNSFVYRNGNFINFTDFNIILSDEFDTIHGKDPNPELITENIQDLIDKNLITFVVYEFLQQDLYTGYKPKRPLRDVNPKYYSEKQSKLANEYWNQLTHMDDVSQLLKRGKKLEQDREKVERETEDFLNDIQLFVGKAGNLFDLKPRDFWGPFDQTWHAFKSEF